MQMLDCGLWAKERVMKSPPYLIRGCALKIDYGYECMQVDVQTLYLSQKKISFFFFFLILIN